MWLRLLATSGGLVPLRLHKTFPQTVGEGGSAGNLWRSSPQIPPPVLELSPTCLGAFPHISLR